ncbi:retrovirus-related pol polyprotein from transposon TNT 1-94 [Tanacetum coccineum]
MANISNYGSEVISEVSNSETYLNDIENQSVHALQDFEQSPVMDFTDNEISSDSNIIPYSQYLQETQQARFKILNLGEVPSELPKVSLVNESLKKLKFHLTQFDSVVKKRTTPNALEEDVLLTVINSMSWNNDSVNMEMQTCDSCEKCLNLDAELSKSKQAYNDLLKNYSQLEKHCISLEVSMQLKHEVFQNDESCVNHNGVKIQEYFEINDLKAQLQDKNTTICKLKDTIRSLSKNTKEENVNHDKWKEIVENVVHIPSATTIAPGMFKLDLEPLPPSAKKVTVKTHGTMVKKLGCPDCTLVSGLRMFETHDREPLSAHELCYGKNVVISRVYYVEGLGHNLFFVGQFCDADLEVAFRKNTCFIRNLEGVDLLSGSRDTNLYTISLDDMLKSSPVCLLSKASKTKSWLWHHRLFHLNFGTLNKLAKDGLARGIPRLKFQKDHLCSACALRKSKKSSHQPKAEDTNQEKLYLLHMDLCGLMHNGTEFVNQTLREWYGNVGITHQTSVARIPQQNSAIESRNRTLVEAARTMLIFSKAPLFLWVEVINTACYTQNLQEAAAPRAEVLADSPVSTSIDQDAPSTKSPKTPIFHDDPLNESPHEDSTSQGSILYYEQLYTPWKLLGRWIRIYYSKHIGDPSRFISIRNQLETDAMWYYFDAFLTSVEPKNFKQAMTEPSWIDAMQEEIHEFERLEVGELVPCPDFKVS